MKRLAATGAAIAIALLVGAQIASSQGQPTATVTITSTLENVRLEGLHRVSQYLLWNTAITARPIGHATIACHAGHDNVKVCTAVFTLPHGRIVAVGETHTLARFFAVVVGGSQSARAVREGRPGYAGLTGRLRQTRIGPGTFGLSFHLQM